MKKTTTLILFFILVMELSVIGQDVDYFSSKHEISFQTTELFVKNNNMDCDWCYPDIYLMSSSYLPYPYYNTYRNKPLFGVSYKYHFKNSAIRFSASGRYKYDEQNTLDDYSSTNYSNNTTLDWVSLNYIGYEINRNLRRSQLYFGADIGFRYAEYSFESNCRYVYYYDDDEYLSTYIQNVDNKAKSYLITPFLGFKYFVTPHISFSVETKVVLMYFIENSSNYYKNTYENEVYESNQVADDTEYKFGLNPLSKISIDFHF